MDRIDKSPRLQAGMTGFCYLITILTGRFAQGLVSGTLIVDGNASMTANNILAHKGLFELSFAIYLIEMASQIAMIALFYGLLRPVIRAYLCLRRFWASPVASSSIWPAFLHHALVHFGWRPLLECILPETAPGAGAALP